VYLRNSTGPLAPQFRAMVPDVNSLHKLNHDDLKASWAADVEQIANHYHFDQKQRQEAQRELADANKNAEIWFLDKETTDKRNKYFNELREVQRVERDPQSLSYERERAASRRKDLDVDRKALTADLDSWGSVLREAVIKLATPEQREAAGPFKPPMTRLDWINLSTMWGLAVMGVCLMAGLFTRLSALAGAVFLAQIYLSMPPWPGLPPNPMAEGHYFIVNKNLVEMLACLALASLPTGHWIGIDALLSSRRRRRRELREQQRERALAESSDRGTGRYRDTRSKTADTGPIPF